MTGRNFFTGKKLIKQTGSIFKFAVGKTVQIKQATYNVFINA
jgi:hypothetical protein